MKRFLLYLIGTWVILLACFGCRTSRPVAVTQPLPMDMYTKPQNVDTSRTHVQGVNTSANAQKPAENPAEKGVRPGLIKRIFSANKSEAHSLPGAETHPNTTQIPRKCKHCIINEVAGNQTNSSNGKKGLSTTGDGSNTTKIEKPKAPVATGQSTAKDQSHSGISSDVTGNNNAPVLTNSETAKPSLWQKLKPWVFGAVGLGVLWLLASLLLPMIMTVPGWLLPLLFRRKKNDTTA